MYGTNTCPSCVNQKQIFGDSFRYVNFINCDENLSLCKSKNITGYPTWEFASGEKYSGVIPLEFFASKTGCGQKAAATGLPPNNPAPTSMAIFMAAFLAGLISFLAPCLLPLLPSYFTVITGFTFKDLYGLNFSDIRKRAFGGSLLFVAGFSLIYTLLGATGSAVGLILRDQLNILLRLSGIILVFLGLIQIGLINFHMLNVDYAWRVQRRLTNLGLLTAFITGIIAALSWIPCITATLTPILLLAASKSTVLEGSILLFVFSLGLGTPFILTGIFFPSLVRSFQEHRQLLHFFSLLSGAVMIAFGITLTINLYPTYIALFRNIMAQIISLYK